MSCPCDPSSCRRSCKRALPWQASTPGALSAPLSLGLGGQELVHRHARAWPGTTQRCPCPTTAMPALMVGAGAGPSSPPLHSRRKAAKKAARAVKAQSRGVDTAPPGANDTDDESDREVCAPCCSAHCAPLLAAWGHVPAGTGWCERRLRRCCASAAPSDHLDGQCAWLWHHWLVCGERRGPVPSCWPAADALLACLACRTWTGKRTRQRR